MKIPLISAVCVLVSDAGVTVKGNREITET